MEYLEWLEEQYFLFLECDGLINFGENPDDNPETREKVFQEWRKEQKHKWMFHQKVIEMAKDK